MPRTPAYDTAQVVAAARDLFWREGYEGTSMAALQGATGLNPSSIYHAFGSKRGLFDAAIEDYLDVVVRPSLAGLLAEEVDPEALPQYLEAACRMFTADGDRHLPDGCLLVNTACAGIAKEKQVGDVVAAYRAELLHAFSRGVAARFPAAEPEQRARLTETTVSLLIAALVMTRVDPAAATSTLHTAIENLSTSTPEGTRHEHPVQH